MAPSPVAQVRTAVRNRDKAAFQDAIARIKPGSFEIADWHERLSTVLEPDFTDLQAFYLRGLLSHGGEANDAHRRRLLNHEISRIGTFEATPAEDRDETTGQIAERIIAEMLALYPHLAWTVATNTGRSLFHSAAEIGACSVIRFVGNFISQRRKDDTLQVMVRKRDRVNNQTALALTIVKSQGAALEALMLLDPGQLDEDSAISQMDIEPAVDKGLGILKALLQNRTRLITETMFQKALFDSKLDILEYLISLRQDMLLDSRSNFLIIAVRRGQVRVVELLVNRFPQLTSQFEQEQPQGSSTPKLRYVLYFNTDHRAKSSIRNLLVPVIIERNSIRVIRELLSDSVDLRREICLDLSAYSCDSLGLKRFLRLVKSDLSAKLVKNMPPENILSSIAKRLSDREDDHFTPEVQAFLSQLYSIATTPHFHGAEHLANGSVLSKDRISTSSAIAANALSGLFSRKLEHPQTTETSPSFNVTFEPTLKYVELPEFDGTDATEREEAKEILDWLRECKGVTRIFNLRAKDSLYHPHSEETIEDALQGFNLEALDWQRPDLSIDTVRIAAPNVRNLHLYASGAWAVIDHWTGPHGVSSLPNLEALHLTIISDNISVTRAKKYKAEAEARLPQGNPSLAPDRVWQDPVVDIRPWQAARSLPGEESAEEVCKITDITKLSYFLPAYRELLTESDDSAYLRDCRIKVAVIDSGVDRCIFTGEERDVIGASFVHNHDGSKESPWWLAGDHHGSHITNLISQLDPCCSLYIAKATETKSEVSKDRVAQAIRWAIKEKVDIINMSLVLYSDSAALLSAIEDAHNAGIVVFCATADKGFTPQDIWPAKYSTSYDSIFPICSSTANGRITEYSSETAAQYTYQGEDILANSGGVRVSGSSVATGIASGIASLILACHRMLLKSPERSPECTLPGPNSRTAIIKRAFTKMCGDQTKQKPWLVTPSLLFPPDRRDFAIGEPADVHDWLIERLQHVLSEG